MPQDASKMPQDAPKMPQDSLTAPRCRARWAVWPQALRYSPAPWGSVFKIPDKIFQNFIRTEGSCTPHTPRCPPPHRFQPADLCRPPADRLPTLELFFSFSFKIPPKVSKMPPRCHQDASKMAPRWPNMPPRCSQDPSKTSQDAPKTAPDGPRQPQDTPKCHQIYIYI